ncbi:MAG TPA: SDR family NAD(P)-dependent oxidoreductase [Acidimicrobiales bacterium]|jgi:NAD(P)-dependent dehydrogenase (short-subunit alcohol dehydrogenase family)
MELAAGKVAVVTGAGSGIGRALAERFARSGLNIVLADVQVDALEKAAADVAALGVETLAVPTDVSVEAEVQALAAAALERFGAVHLVCNNAGVAGKADPWFGPLSAWQWVLGVNFWGIVHGIRAFLPHLVEGGHIVNTASIAGLTPGFTPMYDASKHAVVAITEQLYIDMRTAGLPVGVSVLCPGWVRTEIFDSERNWPASLGEVPPEGMTAVIGHHFERALAEGATPAAVADAVADAVAADRFWVIPQQDFFELVIERWHRIADRLDPEPPEQLPGMPPRSQIVAELMAALESAAPQP